ncbi:aldehyde dehydrogenase family protein [Peristeroidobacter soli]|uniref:aldehyde dehydrogenase family protein n=1 Tax=Peristeroidobacter soli TaxID=2497877 RepID=UPI00101BAA4A|nr:aldehyde dehydrogenase family protein [Peristeroidobacter soli]
MSTIVVRDPDDGSVVGEVETTSAVELDRILTRATDALRAPRLAAYERSKILTAVAGRVEAQAEDHAQLIATEGIKTLREARREVARCVETLRLSAEEAKRIGGAVVPFDQARGGVDRMGWWQLQPAGVVAAITPYNDPLNLVAHKLGPAFALGAPVVIKPHPQTPFSALKLVEHFRESNAPEGSVQIAFGGAELGAMLVADRRPRVVSFTGGRTAGAAIAARIGLKRLLAELGGVGVVAVAADADIEAAAQSIHSGAFWAAGQNCVHAQRVIVEAKIAPALRERLCSLAGAMRMGPKRDEATELGPLVDQTSARRVMFKIDQARSAGAEVLSGGWEAGNRVAATWIEGLAADHPLLSEEIFGPVATLEIATDTADLLHRLATASDAIHAAIFTSSIDTSLRAYSVANAAAVIVNDSTDFRIDAMPFGGGGAAGLGREGVADAIEAMSEKKLYVVRRSA